MMQFYSFPSQSHFPYFIESLLLFSGQNKQSKNRPQFSDKNKQSKTYQNFQIKNTYAHMLLIWINKKWETRPNFYYYHNFNSWNTLGSENKTKLLL